MTAKNGRYDDLEPALPSLVEEGLRRPVIGDEMGEVADLAQVVQGPHPDLAAVQQQEARRR